ncbi:MAG: aminotransferase class V-fold PLP-dependent enzyme [Arenicellales bacterium]|nr:aminotransferase class V-fold PLP-dependent enzyme [Arenicellales bacterium]
MSDIRFPALGSDRESVLQNLEQGRSSDPPWYGPRLFIGGSYFGGQDVLQVANDASRIYQNHNALYAGQRFPALVQIESELVSACLDLLNGSAGAGGSLTSGGTESLLLAVMTARDWAADQRPVPGIPEIVIPEAAHPGLDKAAHLMGLKACRLPESTDYRADPAQLAAAIGDNTIMLIASAPSYPFGVTDPVNEIAQLARDRHLWCHVDACHGGFVLPFARQLERAVPEFDFAVAGVSSISVDIHKLGYANKGVSTLLLHDASLEQYQRYSFDDWPAGLYSTAGLSGSRSAGGPASAWAVMHYLGEAGYRKIVSEILAARDRLIGGIESIAGLRVLGEPDAYLVAVTSDEIDILAVDDFMAERGWTGGQLKRPPAIHLFLDRSNMISIDHYLNDLADAAGRVRAGERADPRAAQVYAR